MKLNLYDPQELKRQRKSMGISAAALSRMMFKDPCYVRKIEDGCIKLRGNALEAWDMLAHIKETRGNWQREIERKLA